MDTPTADPLIGRVVDQRYLIERRVARGGMATVYQAMDQRLERPVAIKIMHPHLAEDEEFTRRFIQEARSAARLAHPNIVNVFDQGQEGALTFIVMEYLAGITLRELLNDFGALTAAQTLDIVTAVLQGLDAAHSAGIVHRDLKPENVLLADDGRIKIADFGLARASTHNTATSQALLGTIAYLSPELISRGIADVRSDMYALGIMMFEMLTGEQPYQGDQAVTVAYQHTNDIVPAPSTKNYAIPAQFDDIVEWCTRRSPDDRPPHARALLEHVREIARILGPESLTEATQTINQTVAMTQKMARSDLQETEVLAPGAAVFDQDDPPVFPDAEEYDQSQGTQRPVRDKKRPKTVLWVTLAVVVALIIGGAGLWWWANSGIGNTVAIPDVAGSTIDEATITLVEAELLVSPEVIEEFDLELPAGVVKGTDPMAGEEVDKGSEVQLIISLGPNPVSIPAVTGLSVLAVQEQLQAADLVPGAVTEEFNSFIPRGEVLRLTDEEGLSLPAGTQVLAGSTINIVASAGAIPPVTGLSVNDAQRLLQSVGLTGIVGGDGAFSDTVPLGFVVGIPPSEADVVAPGDTVTLVVSRGPELIPIPNVVGDTIEVAKRKLEDLGLTVTVSTDFPESEWGREFARVTSTDPAAGQAVPAGTRVTVRSFEF
jgi:serine/threonine protein kinase/beta-lactam-binding protein with PASTA domain